MIAAGGVLAAAAVAALAGSPLPYEGLGEARLALAGADRPDLVLRALATTVWAQSTLLVAAGVFAVAAACAELARAHGLWGVAAWSATFFAAAVLAPPATSVVPLVLGVWAAAAWLGADGLRAALRDRR